jgi:hypothetical protein
MGLPIDRLSSRLPRRFPVGAKYVVEGYGGEEGKLRVIARYVVLPGRAADQCSSGHRCRPWRAASKFRAIPGGLLTYSTYVWAARRASAIDAVQTVSCRRLCCRHECGDDSSGIGG